jgi:alkylation response protein AidB-like acyl-CoA dehydrogenase
MTPGTALPHPDEEAIPMTHDYTDEEQHFRETVRRFCDNEISRDYVRECDRERRPPTEAFRAIAEQGWLGVNVAPEYGGAGGGAAELAIMLSEIGRSFLDLALWVFRVCTYGGFAIQRDGTEQQKQRFLPGVISGDCSVCFSLSEPEAGSDAASLRTRAVRDGDDWVISGQKVFCSGFKVSDYVLVATRTDSSGGRHEGFANFLVPTSSPGLEAAPIETLGHWPLGTTLLHLDGVRVSGGDLLGDPGSGWPALGDYLRYERLCLSSARTGAAEAALTDALEYAKTREQFGRPIGKFQAVSHKLADMSLMVEVSKMLVRDYTRRLDSGKATPRDAAMLKLYTGEAYKNVSDMGLQVLAGYGYSMEYDLQRHFRESRLATIGGGTSEIQRNIIAKSMGL